MNNPSDDLTEIEVTDVMHPLFGRKFPVISISNLPSGNGQVVVAYHGDMHLNIPISATQLSLPKQYLCTKITLESVTELVALVKEFEKSWSYNRKKSGVASLQHFKKLSPQNYKEFSKKSFMSTSELVTLQHLNRKAIIYIRQSTPHQLVSNGVWVATMQKMPLCPEMLAE